MEGLMRRLKAAVGVLAVMVMTGCPSEFGKEGRVSKAVHKDADDLSLTRCSTKKLEEVCGNGKQNTPECLACRD